MGRWGGKGRVAIWQQRGEWAAMKGSRIWPQEVSDSIWSQLLSRHWTAVEEHRKCRQNHNGKLTQVVPVRGLCDNHLQEGCLSTCAHAFCCNCFNLRIQEGFFSVALHSAYARFISSLRCTQNVLNHINIPACLCMCIISQPGLGVWLLCDWGVLWNLDALG